MMVSPADRCAATPSTAAPVTPAGTISHTARGGVSFATRSATEVAPIAPDCASVSTAAVLWSYATHSWPAYVHRRTRFAPMRPNPIIPSCMSTPVGDVLTGDGRARRERGAHDARESAQLGSVHIAPRGDALHRPGRL